MKKKNKIVRRAHGPRVAKGKKVLGTMTRDLVSVRSAVDPDVRFFLASEQADDTAIQDQVMGRMVEQCVYEFQTNGKPVRGLTITGINEAVRIVNTNPKSGMRITLTEFFATDEREFDGQKGILAKTCAVDHVSGARNWGIKFEPYMKASRSGTYRDTFVLEKAVAKAKRNALMGLLPLQLRDAIIDKFVKRGKVQSINAPKENFVPKSIKPSSPEDVVKILERKIEQSENGEELIEIADKLVASKNIPKQDANRLEKIARKKGNVLLDKKAAESTIFDGEHDV